MEYPAPFSYFMDKKYPCDKKVCPDYDETLEFSGVGTHIPDETCPKKEDKPPGTGVPANKKRMPRKTNLCPF